MDAFVSGLFAPTCMNLPLTITLRLCSVKEDEFFVKESFLVRGSFPFLFGANSGGQFHGLGPFAPPG